MHAVSPAIAGANYSAAQTFGMAYTGSAPGSASAIAGGGYVLIASTDCDVKIGTSSADVVAQLAALSQPATQPAVDRTVFCPAGAQVAVDIPLDAPPGATGTNGWYISAIAATTGSAGTLKVIGPIIVGSVPKFR